MPEEFERQCDLVVTALEAVADRLAEEKETLTELDSAIGDADHGANMNRGFQAALEKVSENDAGDPADVVKTIGVALVSTIGGASGPLYGGSIMSASQELEGGITADSSVAFAETYLETVESRGKATVGDKTMVDALTPAVHTYKKSIEVDDLDPLEALAKAVDAAQRGVEFTTPIRAKKGRASYLGWRSVGHQDPGATSTLMILEELLAVAAEELDGEIEREIDAEADVDPAELEAESPGEGDD
ncbi:dihydroxyacetone kinase subunit DhaL [Natronorubrum texcoconense]|uniref:Dihydroxyacetone kinase DhaL subunit n=1 Tax=Natronorubrum texcoconense TaxID=1095776 RepID=A0A1G8XAG4_9EURY|nr:dihydroxyacetone kinase subunit DhaL [Natronorubrum texcoconense]SDJ87602.1 dihydroxyacetone kinase DhaL subunit [Natronorubrum texcoconense]